MTMPTPSFTSVSSTTYDVARSPVTRVMLRRARSGIKLRLWTLVYKPGQLTLTTAAQLITEWDNAKGPSGTFSWTPYGESTAVTVKFLDDELLTVPRSLVAYGATVRLMQEVA